jgi:hypothetical protein
LRCRENAALRSERDAVEKLGVLLSRGRDELQQNVWLGDEGFLLGIPSRDVPSGTPIGRGRSHGADGFFVPFLKNRLDKKNPIRFSSA